MIEQNKTAVVAGLGPGLASSLCRQLAHAGYRVAGLFRGNTVNEALLGELGTDNFMAVACDITEPNQVGDAISSVEERFGPISVYIHNASFLHMRVSLNPGPNTGAPALMAGDREPEINPDFNQALVVQTAGMDSQPSPTSTVWRKGLERIGTNTPRLIPRVCLEPGGRFGGHAPPGGEEILLLSGTSSDESGDSPAGICVRTRGYPDSTSN